MCLRQSGRLRRRFGLEANGVDSEVTKWIKPSNIEKDASKENNTGKATPVDTSRPHNPWRIGPS